MYQACLLYTSSIYGCGRAYVPKPDFGYVTARGDTLYYHVIDAPIGYLPLHKTPGQDVYKRQAIYVTKVLNYVIITNAYRKE